MQTEKERQSKGRRKGGKCDRTEMLLIMLSVNRLALTDTAQ